MDRIVSPPIDQLGNLRQKLTKGEKLVFEFFHKHLSKQWEIYLQPHLNGLRPDFVLLNPDCGIAVFEVKDWNLDAMEYSVKDRRDKPPLLQAIKNGEKFPIQRKNPVEQVYRYKQELYELYCPRLNNKLGFAVITAGVIFPFTKDHKVKELLLPCMLYRNMNEYPVYYPVSGEDSIQSGSIGKVFPESIRPTSALMSEEMAKDIRNWLVEPDFSSSQRQSLELDDNQLNFVKSRTESGYRRIKGPAGSGKSHILAARAAELLGEGKEILVITFNITLLHYLMDLTVRCPSSSGKTRTDITWLNFHYWCKRVCQENDQEEEYLKLWNGDEEHNKNVLRHGLERLVSSVIEQDKEGITTTRYDAVLIDEGQDFLPNWWNVLRKVLNEGGEMLLVADATQDIYDTARSWTDEAMRGAGFRGGWAELKYSYRLPQKAIDLARDFAKEFLPNDTVDLPESAQGELDIYPCKLKWIHTDPDKALDVSINEILSMAPNADPDVLSIPDIIFLTISQKFGNEVVSKINIRGVNTVHTFSDNAKDSRRKKMGFYMGDSRIKATTLHSFKGWESRALVIYIGQQLDNKSSALIYTGLTRIKRHLEHSYLTIISCTSRLRNYGKKWPDYVEI